MGFNYFVKVSVLCHRLILLPENSLIANMELLCSFVHLICPNPQSRVLFRSFVSFYALQSKLQLVIPVAVERDVTLKEGNIIFDDIREYFIFIFCIHYIQVIKLNKGNKKRSP